MAYLSATPRSALTAAKIKSRLPILFNVPPPLTVHPTRMLCKRPPLRRGYTAASVSSLRFT